MKMNSLSPEFHEWLRDGLGEAIAEDSPSISSYGSESFDEQMRRLADEERFHPIDRPEEHFGMDVFFIASFITVEMRPAFHALAGEFLEQEQMLKDPDYRNRFMELLIPYRKETAFSDAYDFRVLSMMLLCAENGSTYSREILVSLYKTFYRKEYNVLKRMKTLSVREAMSAFLDFDDEEEGEESGGEDSAVVTARIFTMAELLGIELDRMWNRMIQIMNDELLHEISFWKMIHIASMEEGIVEKRRSIESESRDYLLDTFPDMLWVGIGENDSDDDRYLILDDIKEVIERAFDDNGAGTEALFGDRPFSLYQNAGKALEMFDPDLESDDLELIILFAAIYYLSSSIARLITIRNSELNELLHIDQRELVGNEEMEEAVQHTLTPEEAEYVRMVMQQGLAKQKKQDVRTAKLMRSLSSAAQRQGDSTRQQKNAEDVNTGNVQGMDEKDQLIAFWREQLEETERRLANAQSDIAQQRTLYEESREQAVLLEKQLEQSRKEHAELVALRRFVHQMDSQDVEADDRSEEEKLAELNKQRIAIVGGHENWIKKMKRILPGWTYISASDSLSADAAVTSVEKIYFYTDIMSHKMYYKFMKTAQEKGKQFGYIHGTNTGVIVNTLYEDLFSSKDSARKERRKPDLRKV